MPEPESDTKKSQRPEVFVSAVTANTIEVTIELEDSAVRILAEHGGILIDAKGTKVRIRP